MAEATPAPVAPLKAAAWMSGAILSFSSMAIAGRELSSGLDTFEIIFIVIPITAPILLALDIDPVWLGVIVGVNLQTSFLTPPFGFALFYLRGVAPPELPTSAIYKGILPFVVLQIIAIAILFTFPGIVTWLPRLIAG